MITQFAPFSKRQLEFMATSNAKINVADGAVRSGKTMASIVRWLEFVKSAPAGDLLMTGVTKDSLRRNVLDDMFQIVGSNNYSYNSTKGVIKMFGRKLHVVGADKQDAEKKIRGMTIAGWYDDETTLKPRNVFLQALGRMSIEGAKAFLTTNPDSPHHWLNREYLENDDLLRNGYVKRYRFTMDDNLALSSEYKNWLKASYSGLWYKRMILGLWVAAEGAIYDMFNEDVHVIDVLPARFERYYIGVDYGTQNPTVFLLVGQAGNAFYVIREYYYDGRSKGRQKTTGDYSEDHKKFTGNVHVMSRYIDPSATALIAQFKRDGIGGIRHANNDVVKGIQTVANGLSEKRLFVHKSCTNTIGEFQSYVWDPKAQQRGEDKPVKQYDHAMDALRYVIVDVMGKFVTGPVPKPVGY